ncbi:MAG: type VI secretion system membrane subunit TssM [Leptothrix sp. (in: b-proteobacteria)]
MKKLLAFLFNRWTLALIALLAISLVIWHGGPLLALGSYHPLDTERSRWICIGVLTLLVLGLLAWRSWRARRGNQAVVEQLLAKPADAAAPAESADLQAVRQRFEAALQTLRQARFADGAAAGEGGLLSGWAGRLNGRYLYELPWYLIIGAPGSGKTTALCNSGLKFPLAEQTGSTGGALVPVQGVGGTRQCDWWFTDQAVLIDTAGRFTTQDSDRDNDRATWAGFLALLRKSRPRQPVNGVLVSVSVSDLLTRSASERAHHAATVRQRIQELHEQLGIRFPIYLLVTKADLLAGFMDYFSTLDKAQRADPWGATFDLDAAQHTDIKTFSAHFDALVQRLDAGLVERLQQERDPARRARIYGFPAQLAGLRELLQEFIDAVFSASRFEAHPLLRGVYLVSGTQEGSPIDRLLGAVARNFRLERAMLPPQQASGRSYFLTQLLSSVVFAESALAGTNLRWERRRRGLTLAAYAALGLVGLGVLTMSVASYVNNRAYVAEVAQQVQQVRNQVQASPNRAGSELQPVLAALDATRQVASVPAASGGLLGTQGCGLYQGDKLDAAARMAYERMLADAVLPRLALRIEEQLRDGAATATQNEAQYETLKAYLMLHDAEHFDASALKTFIEHDWDERLGRSLDTEQRARLSEHLDALLALGRVVSPLPRDEALISATRAQLASVSLPQRIYNRMRRQGLGAEFPDFNVVRSAGTPASLVFVRASGQPLTQGVPGLYTFEGYHRGFQRQVERIAKALADEQPWVLAVQLPAAEASTTRLGEEVRRLYLNDYAATWDAFIADVRLQPITSVQQAIQMARLLSAPETPLVPLLKEMSRQTTLAAPLDKGVLQKAENQAKGVLDKGRDVLADLQGRPTQLDTGAIKPEQLLVDDRFTGLRQYVSAPEGGKPPIDATIALLGEVHVFLNAVDTAIRANLPLPASEVSNRLKAEAPRLQAPVRGMLETLANSSSHVAMLAVRQTLAREVKANIGEFCQQAIGGRYPFDRRSSRDVTPSDFAMLFAPGGKFDRFVQDKLLPYVDTSTKPWRFLERDGGALGSDVGTLPQFQRAAAIRDAFFSAGNMPLLRAEFKPLEMDSGITQLVLDIDGQVVRYSHGPQIPTQVQWPGPHGSNQIRLQVTPAGVTAGQLIEGPWALLRLFDTRRIEPGRAPERFRSVFDFDGRKATFEITASSVRNPFTLRELSEFSCPNGL